MPHRAPLSPRAPYVSDDGEPIEPWFLNVDGVMSTDPMRCFPPYGDWDSPAPGTPETFDRTQYPTYSAVSLRDLRFQLPLVFTTHFERDEHGVFKQTNPLYFVVEGSTRVFEDLDDAERRYYEFQDNSLAIFAFATQAEARSRARACACAAAS
ncbi:hypothetical protein C8F04DRAFT_1272800 [Mycena alexandri]|uniref:Uncharacterized protein n=1 Tax=Mycena alexandri TaxID=1745969 RepID=A0AAD6WV64_9AGAR|nr:hypothetical protein C8F04DRAFT_1272800 [Mycena alexandri]